MKMRLLHGRHWGVKAFAAALGIAARRAWNPNPNRSPASLDGRIHSGSPCPNDPSPLRRNLPERRRTLHYTRRLSLPDQSSRLAALVPRLDHAGRVASRPPALKYHARASSGLSSRCASATFSPCRAASNASSRRPSFASGAADK